MKEPPQKVSESVRRLNPHLYGGAPLLCVPGQQATPPKRIPKPLLNKTEQRCCDLLEANGFRVLKQAIRLRMDPPYKSYTPDLAFVSPRYGLVFVEVKGPHRFREKGIAKAALAAKTYPMFRFALHEWDGKQWKVTVLSS